MPRVVHVSQPVDGGVAAYVARVAVDQAARGWQVTVVSPAHQPAPTLAAAGVPTRHWDAARSPAPATAGEVRRLQALLGELRPDVVHLHSSKAGLAGRLALRGRVPTVFQPHGWSWLAVSGPMKTVTRGWERVAARWADRIVCVSRAERETGVRAGLAEGRLTVVRNGVDLHRYAPVGAPERAEARASLSLGAGPLVVCVGRVAPQKGQDLLLSAWPAVLAQCPDAQLVLVGAGAVPAAAGAEQVRGEPEQVDVRPWYAAADVAVFPSRWEGLSLALLEAAAMGSSIVATDVAGVREVLGPAETDDGGDGARGAVVPTGSTTALVGALVERLTRPELIEAERARTAQFAAAALDETTALETLAQLVEQLVGGRPG